MKGARELKFTLGELAKRTGVPVRALNRYDALGLLVPSARSDPGYRLYNQKDVVRLYRILGLRQLGLSLSDIATAFVKNTAALPEILELHAAAIDRQIAVARELHRRLVLLCERMALGIEPNMSDWLNILELMTMYETYLISESGKHAGMAERSVKDEWPPLVAAMRDAMMRGVSPREREAQDLAQRWMDLLRRSAVEDPELLEQYGGAYGASSTGRLQGSVDVAMLDYLSASLWAKHLTADEAKRLRIDGPRQREWPGLIEALREEMNRGTAVGSPRVQQLFRQWESLIHELTEGDSDLMHKWCIAVRSDPDLLAGSGVDGRLQNYIQRARIAKEGRI